MVPPSGDGPRPDPILQTEVAEDQLEPQIVHIDLELLVFSSLKIESRLSALVGLIFCCKSIKLNLKFEEIALTTFQ